jgi:hypothetical protein
MSTKPNAIEGQGRYYIDSEFGVCYASGESYGEWRKRALQSLCSTLKFRSFTPPGTPTKPSETYVRSEIAPRKFF